MSWKLRAAISALLLAPQAAFSLGLGDIHLESHLNEPLAAEIELVAPTSEELNSLTVQLASPEMFQRYGLDRPAFLSSLQFRVGRGRDGRNVLLVSSAAPIDEPFVTFLVDVNWPRGHLLREYTVLLDPPVFAPKEPMAAAPVAAPRVATRPTPAPAAAAAPRAAPAQPATTARPRAAAAGPSTYQVRRGDTLSGVASRYTDGSRSETNRMMIAMFRGNPEAFSGNVNLLRAGAIIRVPGPDAVANVGADEAAREIGRQTAAWRNRAPEQEAERLRLVPPSKPLAGAPATTTPATPTTPQGIEARISELNQEIDQSHRLLDMKNAELAKLQQQLAAEKAAPAPAPVAPEAGPAPAPEAAAPAAPEAQQPGQAPAATPPPAAEAPKPAPVAQPAPAPESRSFVDTLTDNWQYVLGAAVLLLGGALAVGYTRRRREEELDDAIHTFEPPASAPVPSETQRLRALSSTAAPASAGMVVGTTTEDQELEDFRTATLPPSGRTAEDHGVTFSDTLSAEAPAELDQGDPLAEADFHMAYGLYDQAADIVRLALEKEPERRDLKMKLLEIFFVSGDKGQFLTAARDFAATRSDSDTADWDRVLIMGRQLAPDDDLFAGAAPSAGVDLNLEGGENRVDLELLGPPGGEEGIDLDLGEALEAADGDADTGETQALDFDLDSELAADAGTAEMPQVTESTAEMPQATESTAEMPTVEVPAGDSPTVEATQLQPPSTDTTAEMPMDDLGIDLGNLDTLDDTAAEDDVTRITPANESTGTMPAADEGMDFDLSDLSPEVASAGEADETQRMDLDVGEMQEESGEFTATEQVSVEDLPQMSDLEPVTLSEVGTKLDLARAYVDMGDPDGARSILEEVLKEGSGSQKQEARRLLDSLPGA